MNPSIAVPALTDEELVARTLAGDRDAFRHIVDRYKVLICSVTYNATATSRKAKTWRRTCSSPAGSS